MKFLAGDLNPSSVAHLYREAIQQMVEKRKFLLVLEAINKGDIPAIKQSFKNISSFDMTDIFLWWALSPEDGKFNKEVILCVVELYDLCHAYKITKNLKPSDYYRQSIFGSRDLSPGEMITVLDQYDEQIAQVLMNFEQRYRLGTHHPGEPISKISRVSLQAEIYIPYFSPSLSPKRETTLLNIPDYGVLNFAITHECTDFVKFFFEVANKLLINYMEDELGNTALHHAIINKKEDGTGIASWVYNTIVNNKDYSSMINKPNKAGDTPLQMAIKLNKTDIALALLKIVEDNSKNLFSNDNYNAADDVIDASISEYNNVQEQAVMIKDANGDDFFAVALAYRNKQVVDQILDKKLLPKWTETETKSYLKTLLRQDFVKYEDKSMDEFLIPTFEKLATSEMFFYPAYCADVPGETMKETLINILSNYVNPEGGPLSEYVTIGQNMGTGDKFLAWSSRFFTRQWNHHVDAAAALVEKVRNAHDTKKGLQACIKEELKAALFARPGEPFDITGQYAIRLARCLKVIDSYNPEQENQKVKGNEMG